jgi:hypothetical protein
MQTSADRYSFPYYWIEHVSMNFAGSTDQWYINRETLAKNLTTYFMAYFAAL